MKNQNAIQKDTLPPELGNAVKAAIESMEEFQPIIEFRRAMKPLQDNDLRIEWKIAIIQGEDSPFVSTQGTSSMPNALHEKMLPLLAGNIHDELSQKIVNPLEGRLLDKLAELDSESSDGDE